MKHFILMSLNNISNSFKIYNFKYSVKKQNTYMHNPEMQTTVWGWPGEGRAVLGGGRKIGRNVNV